MLKHRSFKIDKFLKAVDNKLSSQYFLIKHNIRMPEDINYNDDSFDKLWNGILEDKRVIIEEELHHINDTSEKARDCLELVCREFKIEKTEDETPESTSMRVFLHSEDAFNMAFDAYLYYVLSEKISRHKFQNVKPDFNSKKVSKFKSLVEQYFKDCGKSGHCNIRHWNEGDMYIFLIARGDFMKTHMVFDDTKGKPGINTFRPAKEDMLAFNIKNSVLSIGISSHGEDDKNKYLEMFASAFMDLSKLDSSTVNNSLVDIDPIKKRTFNYKGNEHIEVVKLTEVNAKLQGGALRLSIRSNDLENTIQGFGLASDTAEYVSVKLKFMIKREGKKSKAMAVIIRPPENSKIPQKKEKQIIEAYLREQGVLLDC